MRVLGDGNRIAARRVHHQHTGCGCGGEIDVVDANACAADHFQLRRLCQNVWRNLDRAAHDQGVGSRQDAARILSDSRR